MRPTSSAKAGELFSSMASFSSCLNEVGRKIELFRERGVPRMQPALVVKRRDALTHAVERRLQCQLGDGNAPIGQCEQGGTDQESQSRYQAADNESGSDSLAGCLGLLATDKARRFGLHKGAQIGLNGAHGQAPAIIQHDCKRVVKTARAVGRNGGFQLIDLGRKIGLRGQNAAL
jgi:hypothetical protein